MKKNLLSFLMAFAFLVAFSACEKADEKMHNVYFYTRNSPVVTAATEKPASTQLSLYVNGQYRGDLPYLNFRPDCATDSLNAKTIYLNLKSGSYKVEARDPQGNIKSSSRLKITDSGLSSSGGTGGIEASSNPQNNTNNGQNCFFNDCVVVNLFY